MSVDPPLPPLEPGQQPDVAEITPGLFLGGWRAAADSQLLARLGVTCVLNLCAAGALRSHGIERRVVWPAVEHRLSIAARDEPDYPLSDHFEECITFINSARASSRVVLVHCRAGASRSASVVIAYLMAANGLSLAAADSLTTSRRPDCSPNSGFHAQLVSLEAWLAAARADSKPTLLTGAGDPLPPQRPGTVRCVLLSDTHGAHALLPPLPAGDVLIHLGDVAERGSLDDIRSFATWLKAAPFA